MLGNDICSAPVLLPHVNFYGIPKTMGNMARIILFSSIRKNQKQPIALRLPNYEHKIYLRPRTSDLYAFEHVFAHLYYQLDLPAETVKYIIDCGANVGYSTVYFAQKYPNATVIAIEPDNSNFQMLQKNTSHLPNVKILHTAVWKNSAFLKITNKKASNWAFTVSETHAEDPDTFKAIGLNDILHQFEINCIDVLKIDVEGAEYEMLESGYETWMSKTKVLLIELHERLKPGCEYRFNKAINNFPHSRTTSGENEVVFFKL